MTAPPAGDRRDSIDAVNSRLDRAIGWVDVVVPLRGLRPLDRIPSLKLKLSVVIGAALVITIVTLMVGAWLDLPPLLGIAITIVVVIVLVQILARGLTAPLREMMQAANAMADGDFDQRVPATTADEVGELARSFNAMAANIADLERQHRELIANVSHELRTPIAVLRGNLENLQDDVVDDPDATIDAMLRQTERLGYLVNQVLDLSRLEAGASPLRFVQMDLIAVIGDAVEEARLQVPQQKIVVEAPAALAIQGDPERLHQVITNLLSNAGRYSPEDEPIRITVRAGDSQVSMVVEDRGPGIPPEELDRVFDRYHRADDQVARSRGFGLGLAISKWIVDMHSGTITASNGRETGCVMTVELPAGNQPPTQGSQRRHSAG